MGLRKAMIAAAIGISALCFVGGAACAETPARFNLACQGAFHDLLTDRRAAFTTEFSVDLTTRVLCDRAYCMPLTRADPDGLGFDCSPGEMACNLRGMKGSEIVLSTAGPFVRDDHLSVDRHTGAYRRTTAGSVGDRAAKPFSAAYSGHCEVRPFNEIAPTG
jgi:hypothetical protein